MLTKESQARWNFRSAPLEAERTNEMDAFLYIWVLVPLPLVLAFVIQTDFYKPRA
jgi:hypothetical protein